MYEIKVPIDYKLSKVLRFMAEIPEGRLGIELLIQFRSRDDENGLIWAAHFPESDDHKVAFVATITHDTFQWQSAAMTNNIPDIITTKFNPFQIFAFIVFSATRLHRPARCLHIHIHPLAVFMDFFDQHGEKIVFHNEDQYIGHLNGSEVANSRYQNLVQEFNNPQPFLTLNLQTSLLRDIMEFSENMTYKLGPKHDLPISFIAFSKLLCICAGNRYNSTEQNVEDDKNNEGRFCVLCFTFNAVPAICRALQFTQWVRISNMPPMLRLDLSPHLNLTIYMPSESVCKPQSVP